MRVSLPEGARPSGALPDAPVDGLRLAGRVRRGEPLTDARLLGAGLLDGDRRRRGAGRRPPCGWPTRPGPLLVSPGDRVDVLAAAADGSAPVAPVAAAGRRSCSPSRRDDAAEGGLLVLGTTPATAARLAAAAVSSRLSVVLLPRGRS